jgi:hypothetical protein
MRYLLSAVMCVFALSAGLAAPSAYACRNKDCPMAKAGKKCNHKECKHCASQGKDEAGKVEKAEKTAEEETKAAE